MRSAEPLPEGLLLDGEIGALLLLLLLFLLLFMSFVALLLPAALFVADPGLAGLDGCFLLLLLPLPFALALLLRLLDPGLTEDEEFGREGEVFPLCFFDGVSSICRAAAASCSRSLSTSFAARAAARLVIALREYFPGTYSYREK